MILMVVADEGRIRFLTDDTIPLLVNTLNYTDSRRDAAFALACVAEKSEFLKSQLSTFRLISAIHEVQTVCKRSHTTPALLQY